MSIVYTVDVFCDAVDSTDLLCGERAGGVTESGIVPLMMSARRAAHASGWSYRKGLDYCPKHAAQKGDTQDCDECWPKEPT